MGRMGWNLRCCLINLTKSKKIKKVEFLFLFVNKQQIKNQIEEKKLKLRPQSSKIHPNYLLFPPSKSGKNCQKKEEFSTKIS